MINYLIEANIGLFLFYLLYVVYFRNLTFFVFNRFLLLSIPAIVCIIPIVQFSHLEVLTQGIELTMFNVGQDLLETQSVPLININWNFVFAVIYLVGLFISLFLFTYRFIKLLKFIYNHHYQVINKCLVGFSDHSISSFSFFNYIIVNKKDFNKLDAIIEHEFVHIHSWHSIDNLFMEMLKCMFWFNPFIYFMHKELRNVHEYAVDKTLTMNHNSPENYIAELSLNNAFFRELRLTITYKSKSNIMKRIKMICRKPNNNQTLWRYSLIIPVIFLMFFIVACTDNNMVNEEIIADNESVENIETFPVDRLNELTVKPELPGGIGNFLGQEIVFPDVAKKEGISGKVFVSFIVNKEGDIKNVKVVQGIHPSLDAEAVRAISAMPKWTPGELNGEKVAVEFFIPIQFALKEG